MGADDGVVQETRRVELISGPRDAFLIPPRERGRVVAEGEPGGGDPHSPPPPHPPPPLAASLRMSPHPAGLTAGHLPEDGRDDQSFIKTLCTASISRAMSSSRERRWSPSLTRVSTTSSCASREVSSTA